MLIQNKKVGNKGMFFVENDGNILAEIVLFKCLLLKRWSSNTTEVSDELKGQNVGYQLVHTAVEYARTHHIKIVPLCPFANAVFKRNPSTQMCFTILNIIAWKNLTACYPAIAAEYNLRPTHTDKYILLKPDRVFDGEQMHHRLGCTR